MANNVYIGSRYVPLFKGDWDSTLTYESLCIVTYGNNSYTSKRPVPLNTPPTTGDSNDPYWALTGNYNGQISSLQSQIDVLIDATEKIAPQVNLNNAKIMIITDSYGLLTNSDGEKIDAILAHYLPGATIGMIAVGGAGMADGEFIAPINAFDSTQAATYDIVVYVGGANDISQASLNPTMLESGIDVFWNAVKAKFVNWKKLYTFGCGTVFHQYNTQYTPVFRRRVAEYYAKGAIKNGAIYIKNAEYILRSSKLLESDRTHPNSDGLNEMGWQLAEGLKTGGVHVHYEFSVDGANQFDGGPTPAGAKFYMVRDNGTVRIIGRGGSGRFYMSTENITLDSSEITLATLPDTLLDVDSASGNYAFNLMGTAFTGTDNLPVRAGVQIYKERGSNDTVLTTRGSAPYGSITGLLQLDGTAIWLD